MKLFIPGAVVFGWTIVRVDGRRITARCRCGAIRWLAPEAGAVPHSCGGCTVGRDRQRMPKRVREGRR